MTAASTEHVEPSRHSTAEVDRNLEAVEGRITAAAGAGSPAIKPSTALGADGKPATDVPAPSQVQGEGDYEAGRRYDKAAREFVESGRVETASALPVDAKDAAAMAAAERVGLSHSKGEALADRGSTLPLDNELPPQPR